MKLVVLGSGSSIPHPTRSSSGFWVETSGGTILLDCSPTVPVRMAQENLDWAQLDCIWISHFHLDHCGGLAPFLAGTKHANSTKSRTKPLKIFGGQGLKRLVERFDQVNNYRLLDQPYPVEMIEVVELEEFTILPGVDAVGFKTPHTNESLAIHLRDSDQTLVFSGDTGFSKSLATFANKVDLFILECAFLRDKPIEKHLELAEAIYLIRKAGPRRAMMTHFFPEWDDVNFTEEVGRFEPLCEVIEAVDGLRFDIEE